MRGLAQKNRIYIVAGTIPVMDNTTEVVYNDSFFFGRSGGFGVQGKLHVTRFEAEECMISARSGLKMFDTEFGRLAVTGCYDVEFPEIVWAMAHEGANILVVPSSTDDRQSFLRVRYCAQARAIENQMYVIQSCTVGSLPMVPAVHLNYGQASILTPSDFPFSRDGILAEGNPNLEMMVIGELNLKIIQESRSTGTVLTFKDSHRTSQILSRPEVITL
jgi:predicted amidohydrolase